MSSLRYVFDLHSTMVERKIILMYEGEFTQEITKSVLSMTERNLESFGEDESVKRKVFNVMVECLQNICKHADEKSNKKFSLTESAIFMIGYEDSDYIIASGNAMLKTNIPHLQAKLEKINSLDKEGLKQMYKDIIKNGSLSEKGGAGLGFVDMARKSGNKLEFSFEDIDADLAFFALKTKISRTRE